MCIASLVKPFTCRSSHHDSCFFYPLANSVKSGWLATSIWWVQVVMIKARRCWNMTQEIIFGCLETFTHWLGNFQLPRLTPEDDQSDGRCPHVILMKIPMPFCCAEQNRLFWDSEILCDPNHGGKKKSVPKIQKCQFAQQKICRAAAIWWGMDWCQRCAHRAGWTTVRQMNRSGDANYRPRALL